jgi:hypothetical protein
MPGGIGLPEIAVLCVIGSLYAVGIAWAVWVTVSIVRLNRTARGKGP